MTWRLGPYRVEDRPFAEGASAEVFRARDRRGGETVAIKVLRLVDLDPEVRARAEQEAAHAALVHPHVVRVRERILDERRKLVGLVMDLAEGGDLRAALSGQTPPAPAEMVSLADDILAGLGALHDAGVVHRDVKPENVLLDVVDGSRRARLGDLGIARAVDRTRSTGSVLGTDLYIAPEVHEGANPSVTSDLWAVGYVLYEGLFGGPPHAGSATAYQAIGRLRTVGADRPPAVPDEVWNVVASFLAPDPADRPQSAAAGRALLDRLRPIVDAATDVLRGTAAAFGVQTRIDTPRAANVAVLTAGPKVPRPRGKPVRRPPRLAAAVVLATVVASVLATVQWVGRPQERNTPAVPASAVRSLTPLSADAVGVVPTQYQWRVRGNTLTGHLDVVNPTSQATPATAIPELFPAAAERAGRLVFTGPAGGLARQSDGSTLLRFAVPELLPGGHHVVKFTVALGSGSDPRQRLAQLSRARDEAVTRHALLRSDAPTLSAIVIDPPTGTLVIGERLTLGVAGRLTTGAEAPRGLLDGLRWTVLEGASVIELAGGVLTARQPGPAVISAAVGAVEARLTVTVLAPPTKPAKPTTTRARQTRPSTPPATVIIEEEHPNPPPPHESFLVLGPASRSGHRA